MPKGQYQRIRKVGAAPAPTIESVEPVITGHDILQHEYGVSEIVEPPAFWSRGALLNVRCTGGDYIVTLFPEEYDVRAPERALRFTNPALCQNFVSRWYMRESHDPRAR